MNFPIIGTITDAMKTKNLEIKFKQNKDNNFSKKTDLSVNPQIQRIREDMENIRKGNIISGIVSKLKSGQRLTYEEMEHLRKNSPDLYKEAVKVEKEREEYKKALERCNTKEDVQKLNAQKMNEFYNEARSIISNPNIPEGKKKELMEFLHYRVMAVFDEHMTFIKSEEYAKLPDRDEDNEKDKNKVDKNNNKPKDIMADLQKLMDNYLNDKFSDEDIFKNNAIKVNKRSETIKTENANYLPSGKKATPMQSSKSEFSKTT